MAMEIKCKERNQHVWTPHAGYDTLSVCAHYYNFTQGITQSNLNQGFPVHIQKRRFLMVPRVIQFDSITCIPYKCDPNAHLAFVVWFAVHVLLMDGHWSNCQLSTRQLMYSLAHRALFVVTEVEMEPRKHLNKTCKSYLTGFSQQKLKYCNSSTCCFKFDIYYILLIWYTITGQSHESSIHLDTQTWSRQSAEVQTASECGRKVI